ncbi:hypothetical protein F183_A05590 [Bryobacterales bacterium F-183]|nr:hypothetical protein F183_A05590 [Bryobacterales bacterium F-183]
MAMSMLRAILVLMPLTLFAQKTVREVEKPTTPAADAKGLSPDVPDVVAVSSKLERVVVLRFRYMADLLDGIEQAVKREKITNAVILSAAGSVRNYHLHSVSNRNFPSRNTYVQDKTSPADIIPMNGYVLDGKVHAHMTLANSQGAFGGHLERETNVFTFAIVTLGVLPPELDLKRADDKTWR